MNRAASVFGCTKHMVHAFYDYQDPLNPGNRVSGFQCKQEGPHKGSLYITAINGQQLVPGLMLVLASPLFRLMLTFCPPLRTKDGAAADLWYTSYAIPIQEGHSNGGRRW